MEAMEIMDALLGRIPFVLIYFVPGYCAIFTYRKIRGISESINETIHIGASIVISYFLNAFAELFFPLPQTDLLLYQGIHRCIFNVVSGVAFAYALVKLRSWRWFRQQFSKLDSSCISDTVFEACDLHRKQYIIVYGDGIRVSGRCSVVGDKNDQWIALDYYEVFDNKKGRIDVWHNYETYTRYIIPLSEVKSIVVRYKKSDATYTTQEFIELHQQKVDNPMLKYL